MLLLNPAPKPVNHKLYSILRGKKRRRGKKVTKSKIKMILSIEIWDGLNSKKVMAAPILETDGTYGLYKLRNKYSILHVPSGTDVFQYPTRLFKAHKKLHNKAYVQKLFNELVEHCQDTNMLMPYQKEFIISHSEKERKADKEKAKAKKANKK